MFKFLQKTQLNMWKNIKIQVVISYELIKNNFKYDNNGNNGNDFDSA
jgi:hypothetical protein